MRLHPQERRRYESGREPRRIFHEGDPGFPVYRFRPEDLRATRPCRTRSCAVVDEGRSTGLAKRDHGEGSFRGMLRKGIARLPDTTRRRSET